MRMLLLIFLLATTTSVSADQFGLHTVSTHIPVVRGANEDNLGAFYVFDEGPRFDVFKNSYDKWSIGAGWEFRRDKYLHIITGVLSGYSLNGGTHFDGGAGGLGGKQGSFVPMLGIELEVTRWFRDKFWMPKYLPDLNLVAMPLVVNLEVQF